MQNTQTNLELVPLTLGDRQSLEVEPLRRIGRNWKDKVSNRARQDFACTALRETRTDAIQGRKGRK